MVQAPQHIHFSLQAVQVLPHPPGHMLVLANRYLQTLIFQLSRTILCCSNEMANNKAMA